MNRFFHTLLDLYIKKHVEKYPEQLRKIEDLNFRPKRFLVISSTALGDTLLSTPALKSLRKSFPEAEITTLVNKDISPLFKNFKYTDDVILYHGGYKKFLKTLNEIREKKPEAVLIFHGNGPQDIAFSVLSGANFILKHPTKSPHKKYLSFDFEQKYQHTIEDRLDMVRMIGGTLIEKTMEIPLLDNKATEGKIETFLGNLENIVGFQIGASHV
ncbi:MAG: lipopolysaccharide heptosyltransferase family protein, partial [Nitrospirae bacterium]